MDDPLTPEPEVDHGYSQPGEKQFWHVDIAKSDRSQEHDQTHSKRVFSCDNIRRKEARKAHAVTLIAGKVPLLSFNTHHWWHDNHTVLGFCVLGGLLQVRRDLSPLVGRPAYEVEETLLGENILIKTKQQVGYVYRSSEGGLISTGVVREGSSTIGCVERSVSLGR